MEELPITEKCKALMRFATVRVHVKTITVVTGERIRRIIRSAASPNLLETGDVRHAAASKGTKRLNGFTLDVMGGNNKAWRHRDGRNRTASSHHGRGACVLTLEWQ